MSNSDYMSRRLENYFDVLKNSETSSESFPIEKVIEFTAERFKKEYKTSYEYTKDNIISYSSKELNKILESESSFAVSINYISTLFDYLLTGNTHDISNDVLDEVTEWEIKGASCTYFSVLLYYLITIQNVACKDCVKLVQGFYRHEIRNDYPTFYPWAGQHNGIHSWITIQNSIIDIAIKQQERFFDFKGKPYVMGEIPEGLIYMGWEESKDTALLYLNDILKFSKKNLHEWFNMHFKNSINAFIDMHKEILSSVDKLILNSSEVENEDKAHKME